MTGYFKYFKIPFIVTGIVIVVAIVISVAGYSKIDFERHNNEYDNSVTVYDFADKLTDEEEQQLNEYITLLEQTACVDIALVTLNDDNLGYLDKVHAFADEFSEVNRMGFDYPGGAAIVFVDNWSRGGDGKIHSWISTTGGDLRARLTDDETESILNILDEIPNDDADPYYQYHQIMSRCAEEASPTTPAFSGIFAVIAGLVAALIFILVNLKSKLADKTVTSSTYLKDGAAHFTDKRDLFRNKNVTKVKIQSSSGSGGGSGGGGSHGGGGHSR